jgi:SAM-dependent methyltransferase
MQKEWFKDWFNSPYYHLLYSHRDNEEAEEFIGKIIRYLNINNQSKALDVACGKGRHSIAMANLGLDVTGIDLSGKSIAHAKMFENDKLHFYTHDMRLPFWINYFDIAFNLFTSFGYFKTEREHHNALKSICKSLNAKGLFVIDYLNVHYEEDNLQRFYEKEIDNYLFLITKWQTETHFIKQIQYVEDKQGLPKHLNTERVAKFSLADFSDMLANHKMQIQEVFGDYKLGHYDIKKSPRMIMVAKKI